jgi:hypothetical protein
MKTVLAAAGFIRPDKYGPSFDLATCSQMHGLKGLTLLEKKLLIFLQPVVTYPPSAVISTSNQPNGKPTAGD